MMIDTTNPDLLEAGARAAHNYWDQCFLTSEDGEIECPLDPWRQMLRDALDAMTRTALAPPKKSRRPSSKAAVRRSRAHDYADALIAGSTLKQVGAREGVTRERIRQIVAEAGLTDKVQKGRAARKAAEEKAYQEARKQRALTKKMSIGPSHGAPLVWTEELIVAALREWLESGGSGKSPDWINEKRVPSTAIVANRIGWSNAIRLAGGTPARNRGPLGSRKDYRSREECLRTIIMFLRDPSQMNGGATAYDDWARHRGAPSTQTVRHRFGTWTAAKQAALDVINEQEAEAS